VGSQTENMQRVSQVHCLNIQNEFLGVFFNVFAYVNMGHLKVKNGLGFNTICMTIYIREIGVQYSTVRYGTVRYGTVRYCTVRYGTVLYCTVRYCTVRYRTVRYSTVRYGTYQW
jgi:hypothetical protein